jgi:hypothetical protein
MQFAHWCQELLVLALGLEKPRKDYTELVAHHFVTIGLVGCVNFSSIPFFSVLARSQLTSTRFSAEAMCLT